jgi:gliding motility-associated-like protein
MTKKFLITCLFFLTTNVFAQNQGAIWYFGYGAGLDFNTVPPTALSNGQVNTSEGSAVICDATGALLFYTDGTTVWDKNHFIMPSQPGGGLGGNSSSTQSALIIPKPGTTDHYYIFSTPDVGNGALQYAEVDMALNGGNGDLVTWNNVLHNPTSEKLTAIGNCGGSEFWVMAHPYNSDTFYAYKVDAAGIQPPVKTKIGSVASNGLGLGYIHFSPDGTRFVSSNYTGIDNFELYDFDVNTGILSNMISDPLTNGYGSCFSPDGTKLYVSSSSNIYQYDLSLGTTAAVLASKTTIGSSTYGALQYALNGKMYHTKFNSSIDIIEFPNLAGTACNLIVNGQTIAPGSGAFGLTTILENYLGGTGGGGSALEMKYYGCKGLDSSLFNSSMNSFGATYLWNFGDPASGLNDTSTSANPLHIFSAPGNYNVSVIVASACGSDTVDKIITVDSIPKLTVSIQDTLYCTPGVPIKIYADVNPSGGIFDWTPATNISCNICDTVFVSPSVTTDYVVTYTNASGCFVKDTASIRIRPLANLNILLMPDSICLGSIISPTLLGTNANVNWQWNFSDGTIVNGGNTIPHTYAAPGSYPVFVYFADTLGCSDTISKMAFVDNPNIAYFEISDDSICVGESIIITDTMSQKFAFNYNFGDGVILKNINSPIHTYETNNNYLVTLTVQNIKCPSSVFTKPVLVSNYPIINLGSDTSICPGITAPIPFSVSGNSILWSDGSTGPALNVADAGTYFVTVDNNSCLNSDTVRVLRDCYINIPNSFTPGQDGLNDYFFPREILSSGVTSFEMNIFNRWGELIFNTTNLNGRGWDGTYGGKPQPLGTYVYTIRVAFKNGEFKTYTGNVTLLR